jgi:hypothetical protein
MKKFLASISNDQGVSKHTYIRARIDPNTKR